MTKSISQDQINILFSLINKLAFVRFWSTKFDNCLNAYSNDLRMGIHMI